MPGPSRGDAGSKEAGRESASGSVTDRADQMERRVWGTTLRAGVSGVALIVALWRLPGVVPVWGGILAYFLVAAVLALDVRRGKGYARVGHGRQLVALLDVLAVTLGTYAFGVQTCFAALLYAPVVVAWALQSQPRHAKVALFASIAFYGAALLLEELGAIPRAPFAAGLDPFEAPGGPVTAFVIVALACGSSYGFVRYAFKRIERQAQTERELRRSEREAEERSATLQRQLEQAGRLESIGRLAGGVAHDFNNLLTAIVGYAQCARDELDAAHPARADLAEVITAAERASALTAQLLAFSRQQTLKPVAVDVNKLVSSLARMLERIIGEDVELRFVPAAALRHIWADGTQIERAIVNLAVNARDAMPKGGVLTIETANVAFGESDRDLPTGAPPGPYVLLRLRDTGVGMDEATKARLFEPFFSTKEKGKGTGLGLATVYGIVRQNEGFIRVESLPGRGTTFSIFFPPTREQRVSAPLVVPAKAGGSETVLVVEDEALVRQLALRILRERGFQVLEASSGSAAREILESHGDHIHLLLSDVVMPEVSGPDLADELVARRPTMRVLFMSGYADDVAAERGGLRDGAELLRKPFDADELIAKVREILDRPAEGT